MQKSLKESFKYWQFIFYMPVYLFFFFLVERRTPEVTLINIPLDDKIPFVEGFIVPYFLWFPFMAAAIVYVFFKGKKEFFAMCWTLIIGMSLFIAVSLVFPNGLDLRPDVMPRDNIFTRMVAYLYSIDTPTNVIPSIHVFNSLACGISMGRVLQFRGHKKTAIASYGMAALICISTVFVKQHSVIDVLAALLLYGLCLLLLRRLYQYEADDKGNNV
ncbi:MAG: phosphatase PAP2 family protein [Clostridiales bacterium]|nr:phosphatase PAP2 family protein [Clostridiales bacterium]